MSARPERRAVADIARAILEDAEALVDRLCHRIAAEIDVYGSSGVVDRDELARALRTQIKHVMGQLSGQSGPDLETPAATGRRRAEQEVPLPEVLRAYRIGFASTWGAMVIEAEQRGRQATAELLAASTDIWELADSFSVAVTGAYRETTARRMLAVERRRSGLVSVLLGESSAHSVWEVAKLLGLPTDGTFVVAVARVDHLQNSPVPAIDERLQAVDVAAAWRSQADHEIGLLAVGRRSDLRTVLQVLRQTAAGPIGVSPAFHRLDAAPGALRLAQVAVDALEPEAPAVRQLQDEPRVELVTRDREAAARFVDRVLGPVLALPDDDRVTLLSTVTAWIDAHGSAVEAGRALYCHENTVRYRINRLQERLGVSLDEPRRLSDVITALEAIDAFPDLGGLDGHPRTTTERTP